ncbi:MAG TPA: class I SAM-dependent methyltransferase [Abditibacteriaceae bacterium]|jgi:2-polyprenyl-6-hydroxyphenyl methylase/3-demethylubiquinone-9 3-methyltransferase
MNGITFSFGRNWLSLAKHLPESALQSAADEKRAWLSESDITGKRILDVGCGSGLHSWTFQGMGASEVVSFDYDPYSVKATQLLHERAGSPTNWKIITKSASILDKEFLKALQPADLVYSWGVLHHTGKMWEAMENTLNLVAPNGLLWISLYAKGEKYQEHLHLKERFNRATYHVKVLQSVRCALHTIRIERGLRAMMKLRLGTDRGMNYWHDAWDWLGGLPYEVASPEEVEAFCRARGFEPVRTAIIPSPPDGGCHVYLYRKVAN